MGIGLGMGMDKGLGIGAIMGIDIGAGDGHGVCMGMNFSVKRGVLLKSAVIFTYSRSARSIFTVFSIPIILCFGIGTMRSIRRSTKRICENVCTGWQRC